METLQRKSSSQRLGQTRPQSTSLSLPLCTPSLHPGEVQTLLVQIPESQSGPREHGSPRAQSVLHSTPHAPSAAQGSPSVVPEEDAPSPSEDEDDVPSSWSSSSLVVVVGDTTVSWPPVSAEDDVSSEGAEELSAGSDVDVAVSVITSDETVVVGGALVEVETPPVFEDSPAIGGTSGSKQAAAVTMVVMVTMSKEALRTTDVESTTSARYMSFWRHDNAFDHPFCRDGRCRITRILCRDLYRPNDRGSSAPWVQTIQSQVPLPLLRASAFGRYLPNPKPVVRDLGAGLVRGPYGLRRNAGFPGVKGCRIWTCV